MDIMLTKDVKLLTIAGFDPSAGAGILADIKAFEYCKVYGQAVCTALTVQNEFLFKKVNWLTWKQIKSQLQILSRVRDFNYIKIGLVENSNTLEKILKWLRRKYPKSFIIWDPILKASSGFEFHKENAVSWRKLFGYIDLITPNMPEAEFLGILDVLSCRDKAHLALKCAVLLKGGHSANSHKSEDLLFIAPTLPVKFSAKRIPIEQHGSGCTLSALILANFAKYKDLEKAIRKSKRSMQRFFENGYL